MFNQIGKKIKSLAKYGCWVEIILFAILGLSIYDSGDDFGIFIAVFGALVSWVGSWLTYGFGEIVDILQTSNPLATPKSSPVVNSNDNQYIIKKIKHLHKMKTENLISENEYTQLIERIVNEFK